jgi:hypothetical protein
LPLLRRELEEDIAREQRLFENELFPAIFVDASIEREGGGESLAVAILLEFLLPPGAGVGNEPGTVTHGVGI